MAVLFASSVASAECTEDARRVTLDKDNVVRLKSYACRVDERPDAPQIKVELHRFSDTAASLIVAKRSSSLLARTIGTPKVVENDVFKSYAELLQKFGVTHQSSTDDQLSLSVQSPSNEGSGVDKIPGGRIRALPAEETGGDYPGADEIAALRKKTIPAGLKFFYQVLCQDEDLDKFPSRTACKKYDQAHVGMTFWRPMRSEDLANFTKNIKAYNSLLTNYKAELRAAGKRATEAGEPLADRGLPRDLKLYQFLAGDDWPENFVYLWGNKDENDPCTPGIGGWRFHYTGRDISLDALLIENASKQPVSIGGLLGKRSIDPRLRSAGGAISSSPGSGSLGEINETLAPGQRLLVPIRIALSSHSWKSGFQYTQTSKEILARVRTNTFQGDVAAHEAPRFRDYSYGPELTVSAILVNGGQLDLVQPAANFTVLSMTHQAGSCPYLLSWDAKDRDWIEHGKVLHRAQGQAREYSETIMLPGFQSRFRLEEREAEVAFIDQAELAVALIGGETLTLQPRDPRLAARDANYLRLLWGEEVEFAFELPHDVAATDVAETRLVLTGFYERYSSLLASADRPAIPASATLGRLMGEGPPISRAGQMCPAPELATSAAANDL